VKKNNGVNIYQKVYNKLLETDADKLLVSDFYHMVENMKINYDEIMNTVEQTLLDAGFSPHQIERLSNNLSWKLRFTRHDARDIEKTLCKQGCIIRNRNYIYIEKLTS